MKKILIVLCMVTCLFSLTACGSEETQDQEVATALMTEDEAKDMASQLIGEIADVVDQGLASQFESDPTLSSVFESWTETIEDVGTYKEITGYKEINIDDEQVQVVAIIACENGEATVDIILDETLQISSVTTSEVKSFGELMKGAALNTVLGMGTVFVVLILIIFIISAFSFIPKIEAALAKKGTKEEETTKAVEKAVAQIVENEELSDDTELVAVIAAAIAASEGATSTDGFVVRSIKRRSTNKWQRA
ncbi:MAG: OadG family protein [Lachnospiraceae bacterium]|nr:OadG family protein [Lachnospiraceae bacterium]